MAERQGFEPWIEFPLYTLSKRAPSATRPSLRFEDATQAHVHCNVCVAPEPKRDATDARPELGFTRLFSAVGRGSSGCPSRRWRAVGLRASRCGALRR